jgi:hypothetical protein
VAGVARCRKSEVEIENGRNPAASQTRNPKSKIQNPKYLLTSSPLPSSHAPLSPRAETPKCFCLHDLQSSLTMPPQPLLQEGRSLRLAGSTPPNRRVRRGHGLECLRACASSSLRRSRNFTAGEFASPADQVGTAAAEGGSQLPRTVTTGLGDDVASAMVVHTSNLRRLCSHCGKTPLTWESVFPVSLSRQVKEERRVR